jgi:thymidylate kinase
MTAPTALPQLLDSALQEKAVVIGSMPPEGRDLDLLVRPAEQTAATEILAQSGFELFRGQWFRFHDCTVEIVDLIPVDDWGLPSDERDALFAESLGFNEAGRVCRPAPHHVVLIAAKRAGGTRNLTEKLRDRIARALGEDPHAWAEAQSRAGAWGVTESLRRLEAVYQRDDRRAHRRSGIGALVKRPRWGAVITLSGLDGAGKSSQAASLHSTLERLGFDCVIAWIPLGNSRVQSALAIWGRRLLRMPAPVVSSSGRWTSSGRRPGGRLAIEAWAMVGALTNGVALGWTSLRHLTRGRVIIFDRYRLDTAAHMRFSYDEVSRFRLQSWLMRALTPRPRRSYLLRVAPETAQNRKQLQYDRRELSSLARLYDDESRRQGVASVDGEKPREWICSTLARDVWRSLR